jgi:hypothetical protein
MEPAQMPRKQHGAGGICFFIQGLLPWQWRLPILDVGSRTQELRVVPGNITSNIFSAIG